MQKCSQTVSRGCEEMVIGSPCSFGEYFRHRRMRCKSNTSYCSDDNNSQSNELPDIDESEGYESFDNTSPIQSPNRVFSSSSSMSNGAAVGGISGSVGAFSMPIPSRNNNNNILQARFSNPIQIVPQSPSPSSVLSSGTSMRRSRLRTESSCLDSAFSIDEAVNYFNQVDAKQMYKPRPSCIPNGSNYNPILGYNGGDSDDDDEDYNNNTLKSVTNNQNGEEFDEIVEESTLGKVS
jgi:hypothetical protein